jgi:hypothetical protein
MAANADLQPAMAAAMKVRRASILMYYHGSPHQQMRSRNGKMRICAGQAEIALGIGADPLLAGRLSAARTQAGLMPAIIE